jgi:FkbM family methyltransferase
MDSDFLALAKLGPVRLALDIGGNWGQSIYALQRCCKPSKIISFEPNCELAGRLRKVFAADPAVEIRWQALADQAGEMPLYVPRYGNYIYDGLASIDEHEARSWLNADRMVWFDPAMVHVDHSMVPVVTLDSLALAPDVVKIDVQGAEEMVVRGGMETFTKHCPASIIEAPSPALTGLLGDIGMNPYWFDGHQLREHDGRWKNTLFLTDELATRISAA